MRSFILIILLIINSLGATEITALRNGNQTLIKFGDETLFSAQSLCFEPKYTWMGSQAGQPQLKDKVSVYTQTYKTKKTPGNMEWSETIRSEGPVLSWVIEVVADVDLPLTYASFAMAPGEGMNGGHASLTLADGTKLEVTMPFPKDMPSKVKKVEWTSPKGVKIELEISPPLDAHSDGNLRFKLAENSLSKGEKKQATFTLKADRPITFCRSLDEIPENTDISNWFAFTPKNNVAPGPLGMQDWLKIGKGPVESKGDKLMVDGREIKFWGTNVEYASCKPDNERAERLSHWFAKQGVNLVRQHKLTNPGWEGLGSRKSASEYEPADLDKFDYFNDQLKKNGVYFAFSPIWDLMIFEGDRKKLVAYDEIVAKGGKKPTTKGLVWFAKDVQDLHIETLVNLLDHKNPYTGLRYAEDPALAYVEIQNEEDVFFFSVTPDVVKHPTYKKMVAEMFSNWLSERYASEEELKKSWGSGWNTFGNEGGYRNESLTAKNIFPVCSPWLLDNHLKNHARGARLQDTSRFLFECQNRYYNRVVKALREIGYKGMITGSNWQAGEKTGHFLNLASDAEFSFIDRHNYLAGAVGRPAHVMNQGFSFRNATSLDQPGAALLSTGLQQVSNKPFMLSEWLAIPPQEWAASETAIIAFYGMGLQGWDLSAFFAANNDGFTPTLEFPGDKKFNNQTAHGIGLFPLLSRAILRGDIEEGKIIADRRLSIEQAIHQTYDFEHSTVQSHDLKSFDGTPGKEALAMGRVVVSIEKEDQQSRIENLDSYRDGQTLLSVNQQLSWHAPGGSETGSITVNSKGTQGVFGFSQNSELDFDQIQITPKNHYSMILMTARERDRNLSNCDQALLLAISRVRNSGMKLGLGIILDIGKAPQVIEPVQADIHFKRPVQSIVALDADGLPIAIDIPLKNSTLQLDTGEYKAFYYLVTFENK